ncbi:MAG TPA: hypothetical protein VF928_00650 [Usitatibacteraceae bacterium]
MSETAFIITIDTEGDDLWAKPREITTRNAAYLPRFQRLCERFDFKPVYLVNFEMAMSDEFVDFGRDVLRRLVGEIGMHLHAWNSPPLEPLTEDDFHHQPYLIEFSERMMREKIKAMTGLLEDRFNQGVTSHRAGRWALDGRYAAMLIDEGYQVDCSVTPGVDWSRHLGAPNGGGGVNYTTFPDQPYFLDPADVSRPTAGALLEVPVTTRASSLSRLAPWAYRIPVLRQAANRLVSPALSWLCPSETTLAMMLNVAHRARTNGAIHLQFALHSSQLMPGGSPHYRNASDIDRLYDELEILFETLSTWCYGSTLKEFRARFGSSTDLASRLAA